MSRFRFIEDGVCCDVFYNKGKNIGECALFLYGFPATIGSNKLTDLLVELGYMVLQPHYLGTYDSCGDFTPESAFETVRKINNIVKKSLVKNLKNNVMFRLPDKISVCIGYSFGAYVMRHTLEYLVDVKKIIFVSPVMSNNPGNILCWVNENGLDHLNYVLRTRPFTYRISNKDNWMINYVNDRTQTGVLSNQVDDVFWIYGRKDSAMIEEKLLGKYVMATRCCISLDANTKILAIEDGDHSINSLITEQSKEILYGILIPK